MLKQTVIIRKGFKNKTAVIKKLTISNPVM